MDKIPKEKAIALLTELLEEYGADLSAKEDEAFRDMLQDYRDRGWWLSVKQIKWVKETHDRLVPKYENLFSSGTIPKGKDVPLPDVLRNLPLKPPPRRPVDGS